VIAANCGPPIATISLGAILTYHFFLLSSFFDSFLLLPLPPLGCLDFRRPWRY
jgi:hypothetical protein